MNLFRAPDYIWSWTGPYRYCRVPRGFSQTIVRAPFYGSHVAAEQYQEFRHPEVDGVARRAARAKHLPRMGPDMVWYKWRGDEYVGYDWRAAETNPLIREDYEYFERRRRYQRELCHRLRRERGPREPSRSGGSLHFNGWLWICPECGRTCRRVYCPFPPAGIAPLIWPVPRLAQIIDVPPVLKGEARFACVRCHRVRYPPKGAAAAWNQAVTYLSGGLLYGSEVTPPKWFALPARKEPRQQPAYKGRRAEVSELFLAGLSFRLIAERLGISKGSVEKYMLRTYAAHGVRGREALARKLGRTVERGRTASGNCGSSSPSLSLTGRPVL
jgi:DNA-binding CsgD family transcriptional regulator